MANKNIFRLIRDARPSFWFFCMGMTLMSLGLVFLKSIFAKAAIFILSLVIILFAIFTETNFFKRVKQQEDSSLPDRFID